MVSNIQLCMCAALHTHKQKHIHTQTHTTNLKCSLKLCKKIHFFSVRKNKSFTDGQNGRFLMDRYLYCSKGYTKMIFMIFIYNTLRSFLNSLLYVKIRCKTVYFYIFLSPCHDFFISNLLGEL